MKTKIEIVLIALIALNDTGNAQWIGLTSNTTQHLYGVYFQSDAVGYAVGAQGTILKTTDAGSTWNSLISGVSDKLNSVYFTDDTTGYVTGGNGLILKTTDAGVSWSSRSSGAASELSCIFFLNDTIGFTTGTGINKTLDSAASWLVSPGGSYKRAISFVNDSMGYVSGNSGAIFKTIDTGNTWVNLSSGTGEDLFGIDFINDTVGFVVGSYGEIMKTTNGGSTWTPQNSTTSYDLRAVHFVNDSVGYSVGAHSIISTILTTTNGGASWAFQNANEGHDLFGLCFTPNQTGYAVGASGCILKLNSMNVGVNQVVIGRNDAVKVKIYPNPFRNSTTLEVSDDQWENGVLFIYDALGQIIHQQSLTSKITSLDLNLPYGIYSYKVSIENKEVVGFGKLIVN